MIVLLAGAVSLSTTTRYPSDEKVSHYYNTRDLRVLCFDVNHATHEIKATQAG